MITPYQLGHQVVEGKNVPPDQSQGTLERKCAALQRTVRRQRAALAALNRKIRKYEKYIAGLDCCFRP